LEGEKGIGRRLRKEGKKRNLSCCHREYCGDPARQKVGSLKGAGGWTRNWCYDEKISKRGGAGVNKVRSYVRDRRVQVRREQEKEEEQNSASEERRHSMRTRLHLREYKEKEGGDIKERRKRDKRFRGQERQKGIFSDLAGQVLRYEGSKKIRRELRNTIKRGEKEGK